MREKTPKQKELSKKKRARIMRNLTLILIVVSLVASSVFVFVRALQDGVFNIKEIQVVGNEIVGEDTIREVSGIQLGESIFFLDLNQAHGNIKKIVEVKSLEITKVMPDKIIIKLTEAPTLFALSQGDTVYYLDKHKKVIAATPYLKKADIPLVTGFKKMELQLGSAAGSFEPAGKIDTITTVLTDLESEGNLSKISELGVTGDGDYRLITKNNVVLRFRDEENYQKYRNYIKTVLDEERRNVEINLHISSDPIIKPR